MEYQACRLLLLLLPIFVQVASDVNKGFIPMQDDTSRNNLLDGPLYRMGDFDECVFDHQAKYCYTELLIWPLNHSATFWQKIQTSNSIKTNFRRDLLFNSICVERHVSNSEAQGILLQLVSPSADILGVQVRVQEPHCTTSERQAWTLVDLIMGLVLLILLGLVATATVFHRYKGAKEEQNARRSLAFRGVLCFSVMKSWKTLTDMKHENEDLLVIQGVRVMMMVSFMIGNYWLLVMRGPVDHHERIEKGFASLQNMFVLNGHVFVYAMFSISGILTYYNFMKEVNKKNEFRISILFNSYINRYLRLTPCYALVVLFTASFLARISTGPTWFSTVESAQHNCQKYWWTNLLYINNFIGVETPCLLHTWYLAADFQLFCACLALVAIISAYPRSSKYVLAIGMMLGIAIPFLQTYFTEEIEATILITPENMRHLTTGSTYQLSYVTSHHNLGPYMIGIIVGYYYTHLKLNNKQMPKVVVIFLYVAAAIFPPIAIGDVYSYYQPDYKYNRFEAAIFNSLNRNLLSIGMLAGILLAAMGLGGAANRLGCSKAIVFISRPSYCFYLVHFVLMTADLGMTRRPIDLSFYEISYRSVASLFISFVLAVILHLLVEVPFSALRKLLSADQPTVKLTDQMMDEVCELDVKSDAASNI